MGVIERSKDYEDQDNLEKLRGKKNIPEASDLQNLLDESQELHREKNYGGGWGNPQHEKVDGSYSIGTGEKTFVGGRTQATPQQQNRSYDSPQVNTSPQGRPAWIYAAGLLIAAAVVVAALTIL
ncbi:hypothetical protein J2755_000301 [Methanohalophilus levihalophilus]|uniref:hypothetical protein n=1 Tax=Methanohalophilus levihalophilus TaxID=1431282 RepID=UPI001AE93C06|nr:hypothetical protein [Methanohalophilus levihalophilus]MBP2029381.1 hypothetical protein [Methanohalophilus levihalophilus]